MKPQQKLMLHRHLEIYHLVRVQAIHHRLAQVIPALVIQVTVKQVRIMLNIHSKKKLTIHFLIAKNDNNISFFQIKKKLIFARKYLDK